MWCLGFGRVLSTCMTASLREQLHVCLSLKWPAAFDNEKLGLPVICKDKEALDVSGRYLSRTGVEEFLRPNKVLSSERI